VMFFKPFSFSQYFLWKVIIPFFLVFVKEEERNSYISQQLKKKHQQRYGSLCHPQNPTHLAEPTSHLGSIPLFIFGKKKICKNNNKIKTNKSNVRRRIDSMYVPVCKRIVDKYFPENHE